MSGHLTPWGTYLVVEVSSAEPDADPVWVDFTDRVLDVGQLLRLWLGRDDELDKPEPGGLSVQFRNRDDALTPGNTGSPYFPWWKQRRRIRVREIVGYLGYDLGDGYLEIPEVAIRAQAPTATDSDITLTVTAVDALGRLQESRRFLSTLGEHIRYHGGTTLAAHWPMNNRALPFRSVTSNKLPTATTPFWLDFGDPTETSGRPAVDFAVAEGPPGEDISFAEWDIELQTVGGLMRPARSLLNRAAVPAGAIGIGIGEVLTFVAWVRSDWRAVDTESTPIQVRFTDPSEGGLTLMKQDGANATWLVEVGGDMSASFAGGVAPTDKWTLVGIRFGFNPAVIELWVDDTQTVGLLSVAGTTSLDLTDVFMPYRSFAGSLAHVQIYAGAPGDWDFSDFTAQRRMGLEGLERQKTGERVETILNYAGWPAGRRDIDSGVAVMQRAQLAGKRPLQPLEEAQETEQGRLFAPGGRVTFHDRRRVLDV